MTNRFFSVAVAAAFVGVLALPGLAQGGKMMDKKMSPKMSAKMQSGKPMAKAVYVCKACKMGFTAAQAQAMKMKDPMGHKMTKMTSLPAGYKMAPAKMQNSKMHKMGDGKMHKMGDGKMHSPGTKPAPKM